MNKIRTTKIKLYLDNSYLKESKYFKQNKEQNKNKESFQEILNANIKELNKRK